MTFWDPDAETNLVHNRKPEEHVHASEARSAFGSTDLPGAAGTPTSNSSGGSAVSSRQPSTTVANAAANAAAPRSPSMTGGQSSSAAPSDSASAKLAAHQAAVAKLPVPDLKETLDLYLKSLEGLVSAESWARSKQNVEDFLAAGGGGSGSEEQKQSIGAKLQEMLVEHSNSTNSPSWLEPFWDDMYLTGRDPIPINVNYFFGFATSPKMNPNKYTAAAAGDNNSSQQQQTLRVLDETQINRAACLLHGAAGVYNDIRTGNFAPDFEGKAKVPQCMSQYRRVFCASRIPGEERDSIVTYMPGLELAADELASQTSEYVTLPETPRHVVVLVRNRFFSVDVLDAETLAVLPVEDIARRLAHCVAAAGCVGCQEQQQQQQQRDSGEDCGAPVGLFTTMNRSDWHQARDTLQQLDSGNEENLKIIQSALWVVPLDTYTCGDLQECARIFLHGPGTNRWFDRHELIVTRSGDAGINFEHAVGDGATTLRIADEIFRREKKLHESGKALSAARVNELLAEAQEIKASKKSAGTGGVKELRWKLDGTLDNMMRGAYQQYVELIQSTETTTLDFHRYGGDYIKKSGNSPDAFVQLAFQLTHHRLFGRPIATYESASTRTFSHGRTEVLRSCTRAATDFCILSGEPIFTHRVNSQIPAQLQLLKNATNAHVEYMRRAKEGRGVDRHLFGLRHMAAKLLPPGAPLPPLFTDENFKLSAHWGMSTSHCGSSALSQFGFGPVVADGFGAGYMIKNDSISFVISAKYTNRINSAKVFATMLEASLLHMRAICDADWEARVKARPRAMEFSHPTTVQDLEFDPARGFRYNQQPKRSLYASSSGMGSAGFASNSWY